MSEERHVLRLVRTYDLTPDELFDAWTRPDVLGAWFGGWAPGEAPPMESRPVPDGAYRWAMSLPDGAAWMHGRFTVVERPHRLAFTFGWEGQDGPLTPVELRFRALPDGRTELTLIHDVSDHENACVEGWEGRFEELARFAGASPGRKKTNDEPGGV